MGRAIKLGPTATLKGSSGSKTTRHASLSGTSTAFKQGNPSFNSIPDLAGEDNNQDVDEINVDFNETSRKTKDQHDYLSQWSQKVDEYLDALFGFESISTSVCCRCKKNDIQALYKCLTCCLPSHYCRECIAVRHKTDPFHRIVKWDETHYKGVTPSSLGIGITTGHTDGSLCNQSLYKGRFTAVHVNGFHDIEIWECRCDNSEPFDIKLFSSRLFSATITSPKTVFTFEVLELFRVLHLEGKTSSYTFIQALIRLTNDDYVGAWSIKDRAREFQRMARQWRYLHALKQSLRKFSKSLVMTCPACPQPGVNISLNWMEEFPQEKHWLFRQFIHHDANFRLVREATSKQTNQDPGLWDGKGFFVESSTYSEYLNSDDFSQQQKSTCSNLRAVSSGNRSRFGSLEITGIAGAVCRHGCAIPGSFVSLLKGERYVNSDYALSNAMKNMKNLKEIILSYDIACQYSKNFVTRFTNSEYLQLPGFQIHFLIPKFHLPGHKDDCRYQFSFNYLKGVGRSDGEGIERFWSPHNHLSGSISKMSDGHWRDTLETMFEDWNEQKALHMAIDLGNRLAKAREQFLKRAVHYQDLCFSLDKELVEIWVQREQAFAFGTGDVNIYAPAADTAPSKEIVLSTLLKLEGSGDQRDVTGALGRNPEAVMWIEEGLELEEAQWRIRTKRLTVNTGSMDREHVLLRRDRNSLWKRIVEWRNRSPDEVDTPDEVDNHGEVDNPGEIDTPGEVDTEDLLGLNVPPPRPEDEPILLPSSLPKEDRMAELASIEILLREGQANDALRSIRASLSQRLVLLRDKKANARGQFANSRAQAIVNRFNAQLCEAATQYRHAYLAMVELGMDKSNTAYRELNDSDLTTGKVFDIDRDLGVGYEAPVSWIWLNSGAVISESLDGNWLREVTRVQFLDAKVNHDRWKEEVELLESELERTKKYFKHFADAWRGDPLDDSTAGYKAYCARMAAKYDHFADEVNQYITPSNVIVNSSI